MANTYFNKNSVNFTEGEIPKIKFELFGRWAETMKVLGRLSPEIKEASIKAQMKVGREIVKKVKAHLRNQDLGWAPLDTDYARRKSRLGLDTRTLISWGTYYNAIEMWTSGNKHLMMIGVRSGIYTRSPNGRKSKLEVAKIAAIHEFARGKKMPKRPLWNPTIAEMGGVNGIKKMYINSLVYHLSRKGIPVKAFRKIF